MWKEQVMKPCVEVSDESITVVRLQTVERRTAIRHLSMGFCFAAKLELDYPNIGGIYFRWEILQ